MSDSISDFLGALGEAEETNGDEIDEEAEAKARAKVRVIDYRHLNKRNKAYTKILINYTDRANAICDFKTNNYSFVFKTFIFSFILVLIVLGVSIMEIVNYGGREGFSVGDVAALITAAGTLIGTLLIIPTKIIEFIFDREDDKHISEIVKNIQEYDRIVREFRNDRTVK